MKDLIKKDCSALKNKKLWLFDMDGTIYIGNTVFNGTVEFFKFLKTINADYVFITNNSSSGKDNYLKKVRKMGIKAETNNFYTSVDAAVKLLKKDYGGDLIYAQGTKSFIKNLKKEGLNITTKYSDKIKCVLVGFDRELTTKKLETTCKALKLAVPYFATNVDYVCPTEFGFVPDCGSMCFGIEKATGKTPFFIGKPNTLMIDDVIEKFGVNKEDVVLVGDRLYTDILSAVNDKIDSVLVLSGETDFISYEKNDIKSTYVFNNIFEMFKALNDI